MKKSLMATLVAASMLSPLAFASEPVELSTAQMDSVTAGYYDYNINVAPVTQVLNQIAVAVAVGDYSYAGAANLGSVSNDTYVHQHD